MLTKDKEKHIYVYENVVSVTLVMLIITMANFCHLYTSNQHSAIHYAFY